MGCLAGRLCLLLSFILHYAFQISLPLTPLPRSRFRLYCCKTNSSTAEADEKQHGSALFCAICSVMDPDLDDTNFLQGPDPVFQISKIRISNVQVLDPTLICINQVPIQMMSQCSVQRRGVQVKVSGSIPDQKPNLQIEASHFDPYPGSGSGKDNKSDPDLENNRIRSGS